MKPILFNGEDEVWKPIAGYEGKYSISNYGRVKNTSCIHRTKMGMILNPWEGNKHYLYITLSKDSKRKTFAAHRLVLDAFVGKNPGGKQCAHWDGDPHNNRVSNLRWATAKENCADRDRQGRTAKGEKQGSSVLDEKAVKSILKLKNSGMSKYEVGHLACVSYSTIERIWMGESWRDVINGKRNII